MCGGDIFIKQKIPLFSLYVDEPRVHIVDILWYSQNILQWNKIKTKSTKMAQWRLLYTGGVHFFVLWLIKISVTWIHIYDGFLLHTHQSLGSRGSSPRLKNEKVKNFFV